MLKLKMLIVMIIFIPITVLANSPVEITTGEFSPWTGKRLKYGGFVNHVVTAAFQKVGYSVNFTYMPWKRAYIEAVRGQYQASSYWACTEKRQNEALCSDPVQVETYVFYHLKSKKLQWETLDDFKGMRMGATREYSYTKAFWDRGKNHFYTIQVVTSDELNLKKLLKGRIDAFLLPIVNGNNLLRTKFTPAEKAKITYNKKPFIELHGTLIISMNIANARQLLKDFNLGLKLLKDEGTYQKMNEDLLEGEYDSQF